MIGKVIHKLHLYLGLAAGLILMIVGFTGAMMSYEKEILRAFNNDSFVVLPKQEGKLPMNRLLAQFVEQKEGAKINGVAISSDPFESYRINVASEKSKKGENYYINPYTGELLPKVEGEKFFKLIEEIHRRLLLDEVGKQIVGASVLILIVLLFSGVYIYMPKIRRGFWNACKFDPKSKGRTFLYSLHGAIGIWVIPFYLLASLTGLYWSYEWYNNALHTMSGVEKPHKAPEGKEKRGEKNIHNKHEEVNKDRDRTLRIAQAFDLFDQNVKGCYSTAITIKLSNKS
jgi:sulfite reductase (NADPH) flavoprotein alpha-component